MSTTVASYRETNSSPTTTLWAQLEPIKYKQNEMYGCAPITNLTFTLKAHQLKSLKIFSYQINLLFKKKTCQLAFRTAFFLISVEPPQCNTNTGAAFD